MEDPPFLAPSSCLAATVRSCSILWGRALQGYKIATPLSVGRDVSRSRLGCRLAYARHQGTPTSAWLNSGKVAG